MKRWGIVLIIVAAIGIGGAYAYWTFHRNDARFGDPAVLQQIKTSTDCGELQQWNDEALRDIGANRSSVDLERAVRYSNAAEARMTQIGC